MTRAQQLLSETMTFRSAKDLSVVLGFGNVVNVMTLTIPDNKVDALTSLLTKHGYTKASASKEHVAFKKGLQVVSLDFDAYKSTVTVVID